MCIKFLLLVFSETDIKTPSGTYRKKCSIQIEETTIDFNSTFETTTSEFGRLSYHDLGAFVHKSDSKDTYLFY